MSQGQVTGCRYRLRFHTILLLTLLLALVVLVALPAIYRIVIRAGGGPNGRIGPFHGRDMKELFRFEQAMEAYRLQFGEYPPVHKPDKVIDHITRIDPKVRDPQAVLREAGLNLGELDGRESLVFWLSDRPGELFGWPPRVYGFDPRRLVDRDNDGWLEYTTRNGDYFGLVDCKVVIESRELGRSMTWDDIIREYTDH